MHIRTAVRSNKAMAVIGAAALMLAASACSSGSSSDKTPSASGPAKGTIVWYANQFGPTNTDVRKTLIAAFEKANPAIKVKLQAAPSDSDTFRSTLTTQISGGNSSFDVYDGDVVWPAQFGKAGLALPLNKYFPASYWKTFSPGLVSSLTYQGKIMAAPLFTDNAFLFYRKDLLAKAHLPVPTTWEQLQSEAKTLQQKKLVKYGFAAQFDSYEGLTADFTEFEADAGGATLNSGATKSTIDSPAALKALTFMRGLVSSGVAPSAITTFQEQQSESLFTSGQVAFLRNWTYAYADSDSSASKVQGKVGIANLPTFDGKSGPGYSTTGGWNMYVNPHSKHLAADVAFVKWMTGTAAQKIMGIQGGELPVNAAALASPDVQKANPAYPVAAKNKLAARPSDAAEYAQVSNSIYSNVNAAVSGSSSPKDALGKADKAITTALGSNGL
ncbi:ABC transporter substrate-binding protein [Streptomyces sp. SL13]|uniref:ABC transporter substrate-binding protein n=1 Tax=Streptantibioticus silvisoli TaxID=2705255 RepID=A0AA90H7K9_9ACTN|nr:ABC transporter substrate-binding protein [Streptantibioticus silvisoli]MDI5961767.1 ABC transporter substrate-binding protein [Streptantibioticus silvisoli]MDI5972383.1 ABC transporter substrate-binding protein [Streptantibioticus silvisoli]